MKDATCVDFLQWVLPKLNMRWRGFRKVRRQVCKRIDRRIFELGLPDAEACRKYLTENEEELKILDHCCRITISRFYRDRMVFDYLSAEVFPVLLNAVVERNDTVIRVWSAGCASGEEPYTLALIWHNVIRPKFPDLRLEIIATDIDPIVLQRTKEACYQQGSLRNLPLDWLTNAFDQQRDNFLLKEFVKEYVLFRNLDIRKASPRGLFQERVMCFFIMPRPV